MELHNFVFDYRRLKKITEFDAEPLPDIDHLHSRLGKARYFTVIDLSKGYRQIPVRREDRPKTAFKTAMGYFPWTVLPFGVQNTVAVFNSMMRKLLGSLGRDDIANFMDDSLMAT